MLKTQEELCSRCLISSRARGSSVDEDFPVDVLFLGELHRYDMSCRREVFPKLLRMGFR